VERYQKELAKIKDILKDNPRGMTVSDISRKIHINRNSVAKYLDVLLISGQAEMVTFGPARVFFPSRRIPISNILNFTSDYVIILDKDLKINNINDNTEKLFKTESEELIGEHIKDIFFPLFQTPEMHENIQNALDGEIITIETKVQYEEEFLTYQVKIIPTTFDNGEPGVTLILKDVTKQESTMEKIKQLLCQWDATFNSINEIIFIHDKEYTIVKVNKAFLDFFHQDAKEIIGKKCYEILHGTDTVIHSCPCHTIKRSKKTVTVDFFEPHLKRHLEISASPIFNENGAFTGSVNIIKEIRK
jgi:PAS domain S-box-containing protein